jgi:hypothetical protein
MATRLLILCSVVLVLTLSASGAESQVNTVAPRPSLRGVLGAAPDTPGYDTVIRDIVDRLDFENYTRLIRELAAFGDRLYGTAGNLNAVQWIEEQLHSWGYDAVRHEFSPADGVQVYATKTGSASPSEMYILGAHMDGMGGGQAVNDNASGTALVMEIARALSAPEIAIGPSVRFVLWNGEERGLVGSRAYVSERAPLQGIEDPGRSGRYPEPRWLGMIQHDKVLFDHGSPGGERQVSNADIDIEYQLESTQSEASAQLALRLLNANRLFATDYPATVSNAMSNTDSNAFMNMVAAVSIRENRRLYEIGRGSDPHWHRASDVLTTYSEEDFRLGFTAMQTTFAGVLRLAEARVIGQSPE